MTDRGRQRIFVLRVLVISLIVTLLGRLYYVQVLSGSSYRAAAQSNLVRTISTPAPRGQILDDEGRALAEDQYEYVVTVNDDTLESQHDAGAAVLHRLAPVLGYSLTTLQDKVRLCGPKVPQPCYTGSPYAPVPVKDLANTDGAGLQKVLVLVEKSELFPGVSLSEQAVRVYPYGALAGQELGYLEPINAAQLTEAAYKSYQPTDLVGVSGLEDTYDKQLRGTPSVQNVSVDAAGKVTGTLSQTQPVPGDTLVTSIDAGLQQAVEKELQNGIKIAEGPEGQGFGTTATGIVVNVNTGAVLAMSSLPDYDPNEFTGGISDANYAALSAPAAGEPLISRAYSAAFPPGSTFKASSSAAILQNGLTGATDLTDCPSTYPIGNSSFGNFESEANPPLNIEEALEVSCDTFFYKFAYQQWLADGGLRLTTDTKADPLNDYFAKMALALGYGAPTGIDLPNESSGVLLDRAGLLKYWEAEKAQFCKGATTHPDDPTREAEDAYDCQYGYALQAGDAALFAIGQGQNVLVTPLQQIMAYASIANGGKLLEPRLARAFINPAGKVISTVAPVVRSQIPVSAANLAVIQAGLKLVVQGPRGTASGSGFDPQLDVAGKTGTADTTADMTSPDYGKPESWFVSYQPASAPKYAVLVMIEHGGQGAFAAAETTANIYKDIYGLDGHTAVWPHGQEPTALPKVSATGVVTAPQTHLIPVIASPALPGGIPDPVAVAAQQAAEAVTTKRTGA